MLLALSVTTRYPLVSQLCRLRYTTMYFGRDRVNVL